MLQPARCGRQIFLNLYGQGESLPGLRRCGPCYNRTECLNIGHSDKKAGKAMRLTRVGKRGTVVIPAALRRRFGIEEGSLVVAEPTDEGILIRPALAMPVEVYSPERKARLLLENATDPEDYARAARVVRDELGIDPASLGVEPPACP